MEAHATVMLVKLRFAHDNLFNYYENLPIQWTKKMDKYSQIVIQIQKSKSNVFYAGVEYKNIPTSSCHYLIDRDHTTILLNMGIYCMLIVYDVLPLAFNFSRNFCLSLQWLVFCKANDVLSMLSTLGTFSDREGREWMLSLGSYLQIFDWTGSSAF